jgi:hypothetical protein
VVKPERNSNWLLFYGFDVQRLIFSFSQIKTTWVWDGC